jgi:pimeloyl-ACP methyl ester carboxylesterase
MVTSAALKSATRDGVKLAYLDVGAGDPPLLFVHGWCCDHTYWRDQIPEFAKAHRVIAVDLRGTGDSDAPDEDSSVSQFADDVAWLANEVNLQKPIIVGHSMGGLIALDIARKHPDLPRALVFNDAPMTPFSDQFDALRAALMAGLQSPAYKNVAANFVNSAMFTPDSLDELKNEIVAGMANAPQRLMHTALASIFGHAKTPGPLPVPSLFVRAATATSTEDELKQRYPGLEVTTVNCGHFIQMEMPAEFNAIVRAFIERVA